MSSSVRVKARGPAAHQPGRQPPQPVRQPWRKPSRRQGSSTSLAPRGAHTCEAVGSNSHVEVTAARRPPTPETPAVVEVTKPRKLCTQDRGLQKCSSPRQQGTGPKRPSTRLGRSQEWRKRLAQSCSGGCPGGQSAQVTTRWGLNQH